MEMKKKRVYDWRSDYSRYDADADRIDNALDTITALTGCDVRMSADDALDSLKGVWVTSNDDAILRRFRRTR